MNDVLYVRVTRSSPGFTTTLSVDGGGLRGVMPAVLLRSLELAVKQYIVEHQDSLTIEQRIKPSPSQSSGSTDRWAPLDKLMRLSGNAEEDRRFNFEIQLADYFDLFAGKPWSLLRRLVLYHKEIISLPLKNNSPSQAILHTNVPDSLFLETTKTLAKLSFLWIPFLVHRLTLT